MKYLYTLLVVIFLAIGIKAQVNLGFESWTDGYPDSWDWSFLGTERVNLNELILESGGTYSELPIQESTSAAEGQKAVKLVSIELSGSASTDIPDGQYAGIIAQLFDTDKMIKEVSFQYKCNLVEGDTAVAAVLVHDDDGTIDISGENILKSGNLFFTSTQNNWTSATIETVEIKAGVPQSAKIIFSSSIDIMNAGIFTGDIGVGSTLEIDNIQITYEDPTAAVQAEKVSRVKVYPIPAVDEITFEIEGHKTGIISIFSPDGKEVSNTIFSNGLKKLNLQQLQNGMYFYKVFNSDGEMIKLNKFIVHK